MTSERKLVDLAYTLEDRLADGAKLFGETYSSVEEVNDWLRLNEPLVALEMLRERILGYKIGITEEEYEFIIGLAKELKVENWEGFIRFSS